MTVSTTYSTTMLLTGRNTGIPVPTEVLEQLGAGKRPAVAVVVNGYRYASTVGAMGGRSLIPFSAEHRAASGIAGGDDIEVELIVEDAPRDIPVPDDLGSALADAGATAAFAALAPSRRKAHVVAVTGAKAAETRERRIRGIVDGLRA